MSSDRKSFIRWILGATTPSTGRTAATPEEIQRMLLAEGQATTSGAVVTDSRAMRVAAVYACVRLLADSIAMLPVGLYEKKKGRHVLAEAHPVHDLLTVTPNGWQSSFEFLRQTMVCLLLRGNAYAQKAVSGGRIIGLNLLNPSLVTPEQLESGELVYRYRRRAGDVLTLTQREVLHLRGLSVNGVSGLSVIEAARNAIGLAIETEIHGGNLFRNGARPSGVLTHPQTLSDEAVKRLRDDFDNRYSGSENAHRPMVLEEGLTWTQMQMTAEDAQFIDSRKFSRSEIAMFFGVPPHAIGDVERGTSWGSGIEQQNLGFLVYTLSPYLVNLSQAILRDLLPISDRSKYVVKFDTTALTRADFMNRQNGLAVMRRNGVISANDWRKVEGLDPIEGPEADEYRTDQTLVGSPGDQGSAAPDGKDPGKGLGRREGAAARLHAVAA